MRSDSSTSISAIVSAPATLRTTDESASSIAPPITMPPSPPSTSLPLTLILAATPRLGIGRNGRLPWPALKTEMGWFARVTKRVAPKSTQRAPVTAERGGQIVARDQNQGRQRVEVNAVVMGRKTWDSIPEKFRPLKGRLNVVVTRDVHGLRQRLSAGKVDKDREGTRAVEGPLVVGSLEAALEVLQRISEDSSASTPTSPRTTQGEADASTTHSEQQPGDTNEPQEPTSTSQSPFPLAPNLSISRVFVIGGSSLYAAALALPQTNRVLLTKIYNDYECDTFFPIDLEGEEGRRAGWVKRGRRELEEWVGEEISPGKEGDGEDRMEEKGVRFEFVMFERLER